MFENKKQEIQTALGQLCWSFRNIIKRRM